jgi:hypothetical protein
MTDDNHTAHGAETLQMYRKACFVAVKVRVTGHCNTAVSSSITGGAVCRAVSHVAEATLLERKTDEN